MKVRKARLADVKGIAKVHVESWRTTYKNIIPDEFLTNLSYDRREQVWSDQITNGNVFVAEDEEEKIIGFSSGGKERSGKYSKFGGELYAIYLLKEYQGQGIGKCLVKPVIDELEILHINSMLVHVLADNPSRAFYEFLGGSKARCH
ncbi:GNAT family N-acetyltransferase [Halalkalibacter alkalisediminis]|uniref:GNAT family N-acetyltransferase n=1 Tax=Halalkalibacter alkalisediminis TaxID=935616 RepID=A0ABV6NA17_9BACI